MVNPIANAVRRMRAVLAPCILPSDGGAGAMEVQRGVRIPMRDGVVLLADVYLPFGALARGERLPVILERTPYGRHLPSRSEKRAGDDAPMSRAEVARYFVRHGYAVVYQDCRGRYESEGVFVKYTSEGDDGYDTCEWLLRQVWCNGRIGTKGLSYAAHTQAALGSMAAPGVRAMVLDSGGFSNAYQNGIRQGGAFELKQATWALGQARESEAARTDPALHDALERVDLAQWLTHVHDWQPGHSPLSASPEYEDFVFDQWRHGRFDGYWRQCGLYAAGYYDRFGGAATVHISSWYDPYVRSACENYEGLRRFGPSRLILGPWTHGNRSQTWSGDVDFGQQATLDGQLAPDFLSLRLDWFDRYLKADTPPSQADAGPVQIFRMGGGSGRRTAGGRLDHGGCWLAEATWPPTAVRTVPWYLHAGGGLNPTPATAVHASADWIYDPRQPTPTRGGAVTSGEPYMFGGAFDQGPAGERGDLVSFISPPLESSLEVTGPIRAVLWVSSDCVDTDVCVRLIDVVPPNEDYPDGYALNLTDGILRLRYRDSWEEPQPMEPGAVYCVEVEVLPTSNLFAIGHHIRIDIASANFPRFDPNPNTGAAEGTPSIPKVAHNRVFLDRSRPSHILLPVRT
jgi:uncharacterized protein